MYTHHDHKHTQPSPPSSRTPPSQPWLVATATVSPLFLMLLWDSDRQTWAEWQCVCGSGKRPTAANKRRSRQTLLIPGSVGSAVCLCVCWRRRGVFGLAGASLVWGSLLTQSISLQKRVIHFRPNKWNKSWHTRQMSHMKEMLSYDSRTGFPLKCNTNIYQVCFRDSAKMKHVGICVSIRYHCANICSAR